MTILIADKNDLTNDRIKNLVSEACNSLSIHQAKSYKEAIQLFDKYDPYIVILDTGFPGNKSVELLKTVKAEMKKTVVLVISLQADSHTRKKYELADYFFNKYHEFEKITDVINSIYSEM